MTSGAEETIMSIVYYRYNDPSTTNSLDLVLKERDCLEKP